MTQIHDKNYMKHSIQDDNIHKMSLVTSKHFKLFINTKADALFKFITIARLKLHIQWTYVVNRLCYNVLVNIEIKMNVTQGLMLHYNNHPTAHREASTTVCLQSLFCVKIFF